MKAKHSRLEIFEQQTVSMYRSHSKSLHKENKRSATETREALLSDGIINLPKKTINLIVVHEFIFLAE
jgi:hypothetical protein